MTVAGLRFDHYPASDGADAHGAPWIILHGLFGSADNWRSQARALATDAPVFVPDMPNHGASVHEPVRPYDELADRLWRAIDEVAASFPGPVRLLGHSMGGKAAMAMALVRPERVARLVVVDIAPKRYPSRHEEIFAGMRAVAAAHVTSRAQGDAVLAEWEPLRPVRLFLLKSLVPDDGGAYRWRLNLDGLHDGYATISDWPTIAATYGGPTLVIAGGRSPYIGADDEARFPPLFPAVRLVRLPDAGHWVHAEAREELLALVRREEP